jgi:hypothetical protein
VLTTKGKAIVLIPTKTAIADLLFVRLTHTIKSPYGVANVPLNNLSQTSKIRLTLLLLRVLLLPKGSSNLCLYFLF